MALVRDRQARKVRDAVALARAGAGRIQSFDDAAAQLDPPETSLALREAGHQLRQVEEQLEELRPALDAIEQLESATAYRGVVLEVAPGAETHPPAIYLALIGQPQQIVAGLLPSLQTSDLEPGDEVEVVRTGPDGFAVRRRIGRYIRFGAVGRLDQIDSPKLVRIAMGPEAFYLNPSAALAREIATCDDPAELNGRYVSFDAQHGMAFGFFGEPEREALVLRETVSLTRDELVVMPTVERVLQEEVLLPQQQPELAETYGIRPASFLCFTGPPGVGKTQAARWLASQLARPVYLISGAELADQWYGGTEAKLRARLEAAANEPNGAIVVWDEADSMLLARGRSSVGVENRVVSLMLAFTDGFESNSDVLVVLTTNRSDLIDPALLRALRATRVEFERPDAPRTRQLFELYLDDKPCADTDAVRLAREATQAVFADRTPLVQLVLRDASRLAVTRGAAVSGALVRAACEGAQRLAFVRHARAGGRGGARGIHREDLFVALDEQFARAAQQLTPENVEGAVTLPREAAGNIAAVEPPQRVEPNRYLLDPHAGHRRGRSAA